MRYYYNPISLSDRSSGDKITLEEKYYQPHLLEEWLDEDNILDSAKFPRTLVEKVGIYDTAVKPICNRF